MLLLEQNFPLNLHENMYDLCFTSYLNAVNDIMENKATKMVLKLHLNLTSHNPLEHNVTWSFHVCF